MPVKRALVAYTEEKLNCAQSVYRGFQASPEKVAAAQKLGGGKAEGGRCGALAAALDLAGEAAHGKLLVAFTAKAGAEQCREIRAKKEFSCAQCVELAARLLKEHGDV